MKAYDIGGVLVDRRTLLSLGLGGLAAVAGCSGGGSKRTGGEKAGGTPGPDNPLGVKPGVPLDFYNFEGGYGKDWPNIPLGIYQKQFPDAKVKLEGSQQLKEALQPRFVQGNPPDIIYNGVGPNIHDLASAGQLEDLTPLLDAPAFDIPGKTVKQTLRAGVYDSELIDGKPYYQNYAMTVYGIWYSKKVFGQHGWEFPKTWEDMDKLCGEIKKAGIAPFTYTGKFIGYLWHPIRNTALKAGGREIGVDIDNLVPGAWKAPALMESLSRYQSLAKNGYVLEGSQSISHTQSQTYWAKGDAAMIPVGSWLESESGDVIPDDYEPTLAPSPSLTAAGKLPYEAVESISSEPFIIPSKGKNPRGGMEVLRIMLSKEVSTKFSAQTNVLTTLAGYDKDADIDWTPGAKSIQQVLSAAGDNLLAQWQWSKWYAPHGFSSSDVLLPALHSLMAQKITPQEWGDRMEAAAEKIRADKSIPKKHR